MNKITRLVFSGGGVRGSVYPGAYAAMDEVGLFNDIEEIAGSSAGAFTAAMLALGMSTKAFQDKIAKARFSDWLGNRVNNAWFTKDGKPLYDDLHNTIKDLALTFLKSQDLNDSHDCWPLLQKLENTNYSPTFADLEILIKFWPKRFKRLTVTAAAEKGGALKVFNHVDTPDIEIALACRASGALPVFLTPVEIDGQYYIDGGMYDNIPTELFDKNQTTNTYDNNNRPEQTLVFAFLEGQHIKKKTLAQRIIGYFFGDSSVFNALYGSRKDEHDNIELFKTLLDLVEIELNKNIEANTNNTPIDTLIDRSVDTVSERYKTYNWSWFMHAVAAIVSFFVAIWTFVCSLFVRPAPDVSKKEPSNSMTYFHIIRDKLKEAGKTMHVSQVCAHAKENMCNKVHIHGPNKSAALFDQHPVSLFAYNRIPKLFSSFKADYHATDKLEEGYKRLRSHYPLRTVGLSVGNLSPIDFDAATTQARFLAARGYLDTISTLLNLYLYRKPFEPVQFYSSLVKDFMDGYRELLIASEKDSNQDALLLKLTNPNLSILSRFYLIKEEAESDLTSNQALALTQAVEWRQGRPSREALFTEIRSNSDRFFAQKQCADELVSTLITRFGSGLI